MENGDGLRGGSGGVENWVVVEVKRRMLAEYRACGGVDFVRSGGRLMVREELCRYRNWVEVVACYV